MFSRLISGTRWVIVMVMVIVSAALMLNASLGDSATIDELAGIPAGYSHVRYLDYRLNPEQPPLAKVLAALPLLFKDLNFPVASLAWQQEVNGELAIGNQFLYKSGNDADQIIEYARLAPIILALILIIAVYLFSKELMGRWWALLPAFLTALSPAILAYGHYVTTDIGTVLGVFISTWAFLNFLTSPSKKRLLIAGLAFGLAQLAEFSALLLIPYFLILIAVFYIISVIRGWPVTDLSMGRWRRFSIRAYRYLRSVFLIFLIGFGLVFAVYLLFTLNYPIEKQVSDTEYILSGSASLVVSKAEPLTASGLSLQWLKNLITGLAGIPILRAAAEYLLGLAVNFRSSASGNIFWAFLWKMPPASLGLILIAFLFAAWNVLKALPAVIFRRSRKLSDYLTTNFAETAMIIFIVIYWTAGITGSFNIGAWRILPVIPFIYILAAGAIKKWFSIENLETAKNVVIKIFIVYREFWSVSVKTAILTLLIIWYSISAAVAAPYFLSYSNFLSGGAKNGYQLATNADYDRGQDLKRLAQYIEQVNYDGDYDNNIDRIAVDYLGGGDLEYYLGECAENSHGRVRIAGAQAKASAEARFSCAELWWSARGNPLNEEIKWLAVSVSAIQTAKGAAAKDTVRKPEDEYLWLTEPHKPYARAGTSIFIYKLSP